MRKVHIYLLFVGILLIVAIVVFINNSDGEKISLGKINHIKITKDNKNVTISENDEATLIKIFSDASISYDSGIVCGTIDDLTITLSDGKNKITVMYPFDDCNNFLIKGAKSKYVFIDSDERIRNKINKIITNAGVDIRN